MRRLVLVGIAVTGLAAQQLPAPRVPTPTVPQPPVPSPRLPRIPKPRLPRLPGSKPPKPEAATPKLYPYLGWLREAAERRLLVDTLDGEQEEFEVTPQTKFFDRDKPASQVDLGEGDELLIEARKPKDGRLLAENVFLRRRAREPEPAPEGEPPTEPEPAKRPPVLRRRPPPQPVSESASAAQRFWEFAKEENLAFVEEMPDFLCLQEVKRLFGPSLTGRFRPHDMVTADVVYADGQEVYDNVRINGKPSEPALAQASGSWSFGEWTTTLLMLFRQIDAPRLTRSSTMAGRDAFVYEFDVHEEDSHWQIQYQGRTVRPGYHGVVWVDAKNARALRIELKSTSIPKDFAIGYAEWMVEYDYTRLGDDWHLLPSQAGNLSCWRYRSQCTRNDLRFMDYRQFTSESVLYTTESKIEFEKTNKKAAKEK